MVCNTTHATIVLCFPFTSASSSSCFSNVAFNSSYLRFKLWMQLFSLHIWCLCLLLLPHHSSPLCHSCALLEKTQCKQQITSNTWIHIRAHILPFPFPFLSFLFTFPFPFLSFFFAALFAAPLLCWYCVFPLPSLLLLCSSDDWQDKCNQKHHAHTHTHTHHIQTQMWTCMNTSLPTSQITHTCTSSSNISLCPGGGHSSSPQSSW